MREFFKHNWQIVFIEVLVLVIFALFVGNFGDINVDSYREAYIPRRILEGKVLYKDIFCIYAPFSYLFNAILLKLFGESLNVLYFSGLFTTMCILYLTYILSNKFLDKNISFGICFFIVAALVLSPNVFNSIFPYSYGILYGLVFILASLNFLLEKKYPPAYFFYSLAICSKYEFLLLLPLLLFVTKRENLKNNLIALFLPVIFCISTLYEMGVRSEDIIATSQIIATMSQTKTLWWFYSIMGLVFRWELIPIYLMHILALFLLFELIVSFEFYPRFIRVSCLLICFILWGLSFRFQEIFIYAFVLIFIFLLIKWKKLLYHEKIFLIASLLISTKVFFALVLQSYGVYFLPFALISLFILVPKKFLNHFMLIIFLFAFLVGYKNSIELYSKEISEVITVANYIKQTSRNNERVIVFPEGLSINVFANRASDDKFYSLIPLYVETFGEELIINRLEKTKPEIIVVTDFDTSHYYYRYFGYDYAKNIMKWIQENYVKEKKITTTQNYFIYRIRA